MSEEDDIPCGWNVKLSEVIDHNLQLRIILLLAKHPQGENLRLEALSAAASRRY